MKPQALTAMMLGTFLLASASAQAQQAGPYLGGSVARYHYQENDISDSFNGAQLGVFGGYRINRFVAVEVSYAHQLQSSEKVSYLGSSADVKLKSDVYTATVNPTLPLGDAFSLYAKLGWSYISADISASAGGNQLKDSSTDDQFTWGLGAEYSPRAEWSLRAEFDSLDISGADAYSYTVGLAYHF